MQVGSLSMHGNKREQDHLANNGKEPRY